MGEVDQRRAGRTPGPWFVDGCELIGQSTVIATLHWHSGRSDQNEADAAFMSVPATLTMIT